MQVLESQDLDHVLQYMVEQRRKEGAKQLIRNSLHLEVMSLQFEELLKEREIRIKKLKACMCHSKPITLEILITDFSTAAKEVGKKGRVWRGLIAR